MDNKVKRYVIDFKDIKDSYDMFEIISTAMDFSDYFGNNWDAFWDCMTDINGIPLHIDILNKQSRAQKLYSAFLLRRFIQPHHKLFKIKVKLNLRFVSEKVSI